MTLDKSLHLSDLSLLPCKVGMITVRTSHSCYEECGHYKQELRTVPGAQQVPTTIIS